MKLTNSVYCYPWTSFYENNANSYYFGGTIKALIDPGHNFGFESLLDRMKEDGISLEDVEVVIFTHSHPDHFESVGKWIHHAGEYRNFFCRQVQKDYSRLLYFCPDTDLYNRNYVPGHRR